MKTINQRTTSEYRSPSWVSVSQSVVNRLTWRGHSVIAFHGVGQLYSYHISIGYGTINLSLFGVDIVMTPLLNRCT